MRGSVIRKVALFGVLGALAVLVALDHVGDRGNQRSIVRTPAASMQERPGGSRYVSSEKLALPERGTLGKARAELFFSPPPPGPHPRVVAEAPAPQAPPLPYRFAGVTLVGGERQVYVSKGGALFDIKNGTILEGAYRVDAIDANQVQLTYMPLQKQEVIAITSDFPAGSAPTRQLAAARAEARQEEPPASPADKGGAAAARIAWNGPLQVRVGTPFKVALRVSSSEAVHAMPMRLRFNPTLLEPIAVAPGSFFLRSSKRFVTRVDPSGSIFVGATKESAAPAADAELIVLTMRAVKSSPEAELKIAALNLEGASGKSIALASLPPYRTEITP